MVNMAGNMKLIKNVQTGGYKNERNIEGIGHCAIGYAAAPIAAPAPRKENYVYWLE